MPVGMVFTDAQTSGTTNVKLAGLQLLENTPNPFIGRTMIGFILPQNGTAQLRIVDAALATPTGTETKKMLPLKQ